VSNCTGVVYGVVRYSDGSPIPGATVDINWIQESQGGPLRIGGDDNLTIYTPQVTTTKAGEYVIPFFWASTQVPGAIASALALRWDPRNPQNVASSANLHGQLGVGVDLRKLFGVIAPPLPANVPGAAGIFLKFYLAASDDLKGLGVLRRFGSTAFISAELQGCFSRVDFALS
jgi:hypothetical protein